MTQDEFLARIAGCLEGAGIAYMVAGSYGSSFHGQPRATNDVDLVIDASPEQLDKLLGLLGDQYYVSAEAAREAMRGRTMFNVIDFSDGWKADLIVRKDRPFSVEEFRRRRTISLGGCSVPVASAEDVILSKLEWNRITPSDRQVRDALTVAAVQWRQLDQPYLRQWATSLGVADSLEELLRQAEQLQPRPGD